MKWIVLICLMFCYICTGQQMLTDKTFSDSQEGVAVVEFWADWNAKN